MKSLLAELNMRYFNSANGFPNFLYIRFKSNAKECLSTAGRLRQAQKNISRKRDIFSGRAD